MIRFIVACVVALSLIACCATDASARTFAQRRADRQTARQQLRAQQLHHRGQAIIVAPASTYRFPGSQTIILR